MVAQQAGLAEQVPESVWTSDWVVHSQAAGDGRNCLRYLARYVFRLTGKAAERTSAMTYEQPIQQKRRRFQLAEHPPSRLVAISTDSTFSADCGPFSVPH